MKGKYRAVNLEEDRQCIAQSFTELVMDSWLRIYKIPSEPRTTQMRLDRTKAATRLKDAIVAFWNVQSYFQERVELILDVQQNPAVLENGSRFRILKSQYLNNLLSQEPLHPLEMKKVLNRHWEQQDMLTTLSDQLQNVWLGVLLLLEDPDHTRSTTAASKLSRHRRLHIGLVHHLHSAGGSSSSGYSLDYRNMGRDSARGGGRGGGDGGGNGGRRGLLQLSQKKGLELKVAVLLLVGGGLIGMALVFNQHMVIPSLGP
ncbi:hypothetical protein BGX33_002592 [Mortierella sp. NVP41]|nr:hypothetical protein BGX33_002592 [Mortierella sp. NVP41]